VSVALVGTERKPPPPDLAAQVAALLGSPADARRAVNADGSHGAIPVRGAGPTDRPPAGSAVGRRAEVEVLTAVATLATYRRVGLVVAHSDDPVPAPAPVDERAPVSTTAEQLLTLLIEGHVRVLGGPLPLIEDWLRRCAASGRRLPARLLPALLDHATRVRAVRPALLAAGGGLLGWLAEQNPDWSWAAGRTDRPEAEMSGDADDELWLTGEPAARLARLAARRATDPAAARRLVEETWAGESARDRARILEVMRTGLGPDDEGLLEASLDDRAAGVRTAAADLLARLPGSALAGRMTERVAALVEDPRRPRVALPDRIDAAARRDGIVDTGAPPAIGRRTWWLIQLVGATPLGFWTGEPGLSPADAVRQASPPELVQGWVRAAGRQGDAAWCRALLGVAPDPVLLEALPADQARDLLPVALEHAADPALAGLLGATPGPWPLLLSQWVVQRLRAGTKAAAVERALTGLASAGDVGIIADLERWIDDLKAHDRLRTTLSHVIHALSIRHTIVQELS
jgi:hypothetical protein